MDRERALGGIEQQQRQDRLAGRAQKARDLDRDERADEVRAVLPDAPDLVRIVDRHRLDRFVRLPAIEDSRAEDPDRLVVTEHREEMRTDQRLGRRPWTRNRGSREPV